MAASVNLRAFDRAIRVARTIRSSVLRLLLIPNLSQAQAKAAGLVQITYAYRPEDADEIVNLHKAFNDLPPDDRFLVAHGNSIAIWRKK